jgi:hypothetical protein
LAEIPSEEVVNPDAGVYDNATFDGGDLGTTQKGGFQLIAKFSIPRNDGNGLIKQKEYINLPMPDSHPRVTQMGLGWYRAFGIVLEGSKNVPMATSKETAEKIVAAINAKAGTIVGVSLSEDDNGFLRSRPLRSRSRADPHSWRWRLAKVRRYANNPLHDMR